MINKPDYHKLDSSICIYKSVLLYDSQSLFVQNKNKIAKGALCPKKVASISLK